MPTRIPTITTAAPRGLLLRNRGIPVALAAAVTLVMSTSCAESGASEADTSPQATPQSAPVRVHYPRGLSFVAPFAVMQESADPSKVTFDTWASPDVMRSLITSGKSDLIATPSYTGANLHNKGVDVRLLAVTVWGSLHLIGPKDAPPDWQSLKGSTIVTFFKGDMPDLVLQYLLRKNGLTPGKDVTIEYVSEPAEVSSALVSGKASYGVLPEQAATMTVKKAGEAGRALTSVIDMQAAWAKATGQSEPRMPQAGILVRGDLPEKNPQELSAIAKEIDASIGRLNAGDSDALRLVSERSKVPQPLVTSVMPRLNLEYVPAKQARAELERFYTELATLDPQIIGGKLPDDAFYLDDVR
ncbi:ABC transporter substrate-binding protein [Gephyromycinifex aptenodytis]|uniref:ABC transporter substrate-binding protein n=1 Tax=Gephyromycinifex aptenodytis TaxID=2716227 RepID=UPI001446514D|nr:PhnD/SsuA/transferrin family substrate-binding protein [Gephyromycinifex aptenodytis]